MKKIIIFIGILLVLHCENVKGLIFEYEKESGYLFKITWKNGATLSKTSAMYKISGQSKIYYDITPTETLFKAHTHSQAELKLDFETYKEIAKIMYYGYGYKNHTTNKHYFATQFLIFKQLEEAEVAIVNSDGEPTEYTQKEINEIKNVIKENEFKPEEYETDTNALHINNEYIIENFELEIEDGTITKDKDGYKIDLLNNKETYYLNLKPKNNCLPIDYWESKIGHGILGISGLCENETTILINRTYKETIPEEESNDTKENENSEENIPSTPNDNNYYVEENVTSTPNDSDYYVEEEIEVNVPNTSKYSLSWLIILICIGNLYYVCKK